MAKLYFVENNAGTITYAVSDKTGAACVEWNMGNIPNYPADVPGWLDMDPDARTKIAKKYLREEIAAYNDFDELYTDCWSHDDGYHGQLTPEDVQEDFAENCCNIIATVEIPEQDNTKAFFQ